MVVICAQCYFANLLSYCMSVGDCFISPNSIEKESLTCVYVYGCFLGSNILQVIA